jgi:hypothetical protein
MTLNIDLVLNQYENFLAREFSHRFFKHRDIEKRIAELPPEFQQRKLGHSYQGRSITSLLWGKGSTKIMLWSQMHGDEATGTLALLDLFNYLQLDNELSKFLFETCQLQFIPLVNPDGAEIFTRRNAQQIDINRDYLTEISPEAKILKQCRADFKPSFGFNLHDQNTLWSVSGTKQSASLSFLAPAYDAQLSTNKVRENAMRVIAEIYQQLNPLLPRKIALFDDEFEARAFGDNFQKAGTSTLLIEAGGLKNDDEKQKLRRYYFAAILTGLHAIATNSYPQQDLKRYYSIPKNNKQIFHLLIHLVIINQQEMSIGINYEEQVDSNFQSVQKKYSIADIGDLSTYGAYTVLDGKGATLEGEIAFEKPAHFSLSLRNQIIIAFENGKLLQKH